MPTPFDWQPFLRKKIGLSLVICLTFCMSVPMTSNALGQYNDSDSYLNPTVEIRLGSPGYLTDDLLDTAVFQRAVDDVAAGGGGKLIVPRGTYEIAEVYLQSDVHIVFDGQSTVRGNATGFSPDRNINLFRLGDGNASAPGVNNVSIRSLHSPTRFEFDRSHHDRIRAFRVGDANNFLISNFNVADTRTTFSGISLGWAGDNPDGTARLPDGGTVEHFRSNNAHYGYGAIQAQGSKNVEFRDIEAVGGIAARTETGFSALNQALGAASRQESSIDNILAQDISSFHGQAALFLAPHTLSQGSVTGRNISSSGREMGNGVANIDDARKPLRRSELNNPF